MKYFISLFFVIFFLTSATIFSQEALEDVIHFKNGSIIRGTIIEQIPNESIKIKTKDGKIYVFKMNEVQKIVKEKSSAQLKRGNLRLKSPGTAFALSLLSPGIGQFYNGDVGQGFAHLGIHLVSAVAGIAFAIHNEPEQDALTVGFLGIAGVNYIWSLVDAVRTSNKINEKRRAQFGHLFEFEYKQKIVGIDLGMQEETLTPGIVVHF